MTVCECGGVWKVKDSNGVTDPRDGDRVEIWECAACGNQKSKVLKA